MAGEDSTQQVNLVALAAKIVGDAGTNVTLSVARVQEAPPPPPPSPGRSAAPALPEECFNVTLTRAVAPPGSGGAAERPLAHLRNPRKGD